ncbi:type III secretion apparatus H+-transporting two-sector ATPase [Burkholderia ubonensis]|nr:type III secretion apparatus H+-transporting two-sector ATPase [Burkholderia ubonensis]
MGEAIVNRTALDPVITARIVSWRARMLDAVYGASLTESLGRVTQVIGTLIEGTVPNASIGEICEVYDPENPAIRVMAEVVGFNDVSTMLSPLGPIEGTSSRFLIKPLRRRHHVAVGTSLLGRVLDGFGIPIDGRPADTSAEGPLVLVPVIAEAELPTKRPRITKPFPTGVRVLDSVLTVGEGQRIGLFAGPGCGKTTIMAAIARGSGVDAVVFGLIGERGREIREFTEHELSPELLAKSVLVCATSDRTAIERSRAAFTATAIAEGLRDQGLRVLLLIDSLTRLARAQREIGLAAGEPPARAGFPPSVYSLLPRLIERAGNTERGSITAIYTVLLEGEIKGDPISEEAVSLLDGHVLLSKKLVEQGHFPAIDVLPSLSRTMSNIVPKPHMRAAMRLRSLLSKYNEIEMLIRLGEYRPGMDAEIDKAVDAYPKLIAFLRQDTSTPTSWTENTNGLIELIEIL